MMADSEAQNEEILVLQSIYDEKSFFVESMCPPCGRFTADVQLPDPFLVKNSNNTETHAHSDCSKLNLEEFEVKYLPPINLYFEFPESYPTNSPPAFLLSCSWLSYEQLSRICKHFDALWEEGNNEVILFQWFQFLKEETLSFLNMENYLDITELSMFKLIKDDVRTGSSVIEPLRGENIISNTCAESPEKKVTCMPCMTPSISGGGNSRDRRAFLELPDGKVLKNLLKEYNQMKEAEHFSNTWHECNICFVSKLGSEFVAFTKCNHSFCKECIKSYFEVMIGEGNVNSLNCPQDKCSNQADGTLVRKVVSSAYFERYDSLMLTRTLDTMPDLAYCPRKACQCALIIDVSGRIGTCPACKFVFCPFCRMVYHGIAPCNIKSEVKQKIFNEYIHGDERTKLELEMRHGRRTIKSLVDDILSENWIESHGKRCPHCNASIEKNEGCNKMTCYKCGTFFCWLCLQILKSSNPYSHFHDRNSDCYNKLFPDEFFDYEFEAGEFLNF